MRYICLLYGDDGAGPAPRTAEFGEMLREYGAATQEMTGAGVLVDSGPLQPVTSATTLRLRDGELQLTDGAELEGSVGVGQLGAAGGQIGAE